MLPLDRRPGTAINTTDRERQTSLRGRLITPELFLTDGRSVEATAFNNDWNSAKKTGQLVVVSGCGDARFFHNPKDAVVLRNITGAVIPTELQGPDGVLSPEFGTKLAVIMTHYDGRLIQNGVAPDGCGGRTEKRQMARHDIRSEIALADAEHFVVHRVKSHDPMILALGSAIETAEKSGTPALAAAINHMSGELDILGAVLPTKDAEGKPTIITGLSPDINIDTLLNGEYPEELIYKNGIPTLSHDQIPQIFHKFLEEHTDYLTQLNGWRADLAEKQAIQNPHNILFTTSLRSPRGRLPSIAKASINDLFTVTVPKDPDVQSTADVNSDVNDNTLIHALNQLSYPFLSARANKGENNKAFAALWNEQTTVTFETRSLATSYALVEEALKRPWFKEWAEKNGNKIIVVKTINGIPQEAEYFDPTKAQTIQAN